MPQKPTSTRFLPTNFAKEPYFFADTTIKTKMSHGILGKTIGSPLISQMARQLRLTNSQFLGLIDCTLSEQDYRTIIDEHNETE